MPGIVAVFDRLTGAMAAAAGSVLAAITLMIVADIGLRNIGPGRGVPGVIELVEYGLYAAMLLGAPWVLRLRAHVTVEILLDAMPRVARRRAEAASDAIGVAVCLAIAYGGAVATMKSFAAGRLVFQTYVFPEWWLLAPLPLAALLLSAEFVLRMSGVRRRLKDGGPSKAADGPA